MLNNVIIDRVPGSTTTDSGIILRNTLEQDRGIVVSTGPDVTEVTVGDIVVLNWNAAKKIEEEFFVVPVDDIIAIIE